MHVTNFAASFLTFRIDWNLKPSLTSSHKPPFTLNNARILIESICQITDRVTGVSKRYVLGASCKTEYVGVEAGIWTDPNADFCIILSQESYLILKSWDRNNKGVMLYPVSLGEQPERQSGHVADTYDAIRLNVRTVAARALESPEVIIAATLADEVLVGRSAFTLIERYDIEIEFPIKTMNANEREIIYQTDTGPILFPDLTNGDENWIERFHLAYIAFNRPDWVELVLQVSTRLSENISVNHYARTMQLGAQNSLFSVLCDSKG